MIKEISIKLLASSSIDLIAAKQWIVDILGHESFIGLPIGKDVTPAGLIVMCAAKRCYNAFTSEHNKNLTRVRDELAPHIENILSSGHGSVLEHVTFTFAIEGITRVLTGELNRHRAGVAVSEASGRYIRFDDDIAYRLPNCFRHVPSTIPATIVSNRKREKSRKIMEEVFDYIADQYRNLEDIWKEELEGDFAAKKELTSAFRRIVPMGYCGGGVWTFNVRALRHILTLRSSFHAEEEIRELAGKMFDILKKEEPLLFCDMEKDFNGVITREYTA